MPHSNQPAETKVETKIEKAYTTLSVASVGLEMGISILVSWGIGYYLDKRFGTDPYLMLLFLGVGIAAGFKALIRVAKQAKSASKESDR